jgi:hypothetical protein
MVGSKRIESPTGVVAAQALVVDHLSWRTRRNPAEREGVGEAHLVRIGKSINHQNMRMKRMIRRIV